MDIQPGKVFHEKHPDQSVDHLSLNNNTHHQVHMSQSSLGSPQSVYTKIQ